MRSAEVPTLFEQFEALTLDPQQFTHARHLEFAWRYLQREGFPAGAVRFAEHLKKYVAAVGAAAKYHETMTWAYLLMLNEERELRSPPGEAFAAMIERRPDLLAHRGGALDAIYPPTQLADPDTKRVFVLPRRETRATSP